MLEDEKYRKIQKWDKVRPSQEPGMVPAVHVAVGRSGGQGGPPWRMGDWQKGMKDRKNQAGSYLGHPREECAGQRDWLEQRI